MPLPPGEKIPVEEGEGRASNELRTVLEGMEVRGEYMDKGEDAEVEKDVVKAEWVGVGGDPCWN